MSKKPRRRTTTSAITVGLAVLLWLVPSEARSDTQVGLMVDTGVPAGLVGALAFRPHQKIAFHVGLGHNTSGPGVRGGLSLELFHSVISPFVAVELGSYDTAEPAEWMRAIVRDAGVDSATWDTVAYHFANTHGGFRIGSQNVALFIQGGVSLLQSTVGWTQNNPADGGGRVTFRVWVPTARIGLMFYL